MNSPAVTVRKIRENFSSLQDILLFMRILSLVAVLPAMLRLLSIPMLMRMLTPRPTISFRNPVTDEVRDKIVKYTDYIQGRNFWMFKSTCLRRSLVLYHFLRRAGLNVQICIGVRYKEDSQGEESSRDLEGHAWLLYKGEIFLERNVAMAKTYAVTYQFPPGKEYSPWDGLEVTGEKS